MTISGYILVFLLIATPLILNTLNKRVLRSKYTSDDIAFMSSAAVFVFFIIISILLRYQADAALNAFDPDGDGVFSAAEPTPDFYEVMPKWTADFGIVYAVMFGWIFSALYYKVLQFLFKRGKTEK